MRPESEEGTMVDRADRDRWQEMIEQMYPRRWYARRGSVPDEWNLPPGAVMLIEPMPWSLVFHDFWTQVAIVAFFYQETPARRRELARQEQRKRVGRTYP